MIQLKETIEVIQEEMSEVQDVLSVTSIDRHQQKEITNARNRRVVSMLGGMKNFKYILFANKYYGQCLKDMKNKFNIATYKDLAKTELQEALNYISNWKPNVHTEKSIIADWLVKRDNGDIKKGNLRALNEYLILNSGFGQNNQVFNCYTYLLYWCECQAPMKYPGPSHLGFCRNLMKMIMSKKSQLSINACMI
ncbi:ORF6C domain-containing protein [Paenibacillus sp. FSL E2-0178]|uniref:ORF6C domain-containing protein n=1 Tax=Paenibacillus sp. FSL E2-0178 TaxID=2921361 RepID=UPI003158B161